MFSCEFRKKFKNTLFHRAPPVAVSVFFLQPSEKMQSECVSVEYKSEDSTLELQCRCFRGAIQAHCATFNVDSTLGVGEGGGLNC